MKWSPASRPCRSKPAMPSAAVSPATSRAPRDRRPPASGSVTSPWTVVDEHYVLEREEELRKTADLVTGKKTEGDR
jgi:hypothetical protein